MDLRYRGREVESTRILHPGKPKRMSKAEKRLLKRRQAVEPSIGHLKADHRMRRNFLKGALGDAMNPILAAAGFNIRWMMRRLMIFGAGCYPAFCGCWVRVARMPAQTQRQRPHSGMFRAD
ncbi:hypothetical protein V6X63_10580 [Spiribacter sp. 221]|uniref:hypothetical protein n=1 Tax=Spiribacter onubensis TaxID=3122420 RepID=UPI00349F5C37